MYPLFFWQHLVRIVKIPMHQGSLHLVVGVDFLGFGVEPCARLNSRVCTSQFSSSTSAGSVEQVEKYSDVRFEVTEAPPRWEGV